MEIEKYKLYPTGNRTIRLAGIDWIVIASEKYSRLLLAQEAISIRPYDCDFTHDVWETCSLRRYLNTIFLNRFAPAEKRKLIKKRLKNLPNPIFGTSGGSDTYDYVFVLSLEEIDMYITRIKLPMNGLTDYSDIDVNVYCDDNNIYRIALYQKEPVSWWLRTPGVSDSSAVAVLSDGGICVAGLDLNAIMDLGGVGVRPAIWVKEI